MSVKTICFFNSTKSWGGGEKWHHDMALEMHKQGYNVIVFTNKNSELFKKLENCGIKIFPLKVSNLSFTNPFKISKTSKILKENSVSHIIINLSADLKIAGIASKKAKIKNIIYRRGSAIPVKNSFLNRYIFGKIVTNIIANTEATKKTINQNNSNLFPEEKIKVIYNGISLTEFDNQKFRLEEKKSGQIIIGNIGRLVKQKAQHYFIDLAKDLKSRNIDFKILIGGEGKLEEDLKNQCKREYLENEIIFTGFVKDTKQFLVNIDIFLLTSLWEGFGYVLVEAMACAKPTIAFNLSSNPEIIDDNKTGYLIEFANIQEISEKIIFLKENPAILKEFGEKGRQKALQMFTFEQSFKNFEKFIINSQQ
ncbi:MAG: glycosyltransferase family 4 protein [Bacteroidales bacterium]|nr:glycosyltransferase family 4 protein [Bacteroidales bacterium]